MKIIQVNTQTYYEYLLLNCLITQYNADQILNVQYVIIPCVIPFSKGITGSSKPFYQVQKLSGNPGLVLTSNLLHSKLLQNETVSLKYYWYQNNNLKLVLFHSLTILIPFSHLPVRVKFHWVTSPVAYLKRI